MPAMSEMMSSGGMMSPGELMSSGAVGEMPQPAVPQAAVDASRRLLAPKGSCWYCEKPVGEIRRFCGKACAAAFEDEKEFNLPPVGSNVPYQAPL
jgi:hypothetical protein